MSVQIEVLDNSVGVNLTDEDFIEFFTAAFSPQIAQTLLSWNNDFTEVYPNATESIEKIRKIVEYFPEVKIIIDDKAETIIQVDQPLKGYRGHVLYGFPTNARIPVGGIEYKGLSDPVLIGEDLYQTALIKPNYHPQEPQFTEPLPPLTYPDTTKDVPKYIQDQAVKHHIMLGGDYEFVFLKLGIYDQICKALISGKKAEIVWPEKKILKFDKILKDAVFIQTARRLFAKKLMNVRDNAKTIRDMLTAEEIRIVERQLEHKAVKTSCDHYSETNIFYNSTDGGKKKIALDKVLTFAKDRKGLIQCKKCNQDLICSHYLAKDLITFYGPPLGGYYYCKVCGEQIGISEDHFVLDKDFSTKEHTPDSLRNLTWRIANDIMKYVKFSKIINKAEFIDEMIGICFPILETIRATLNKRYVNHSDVTDHTIYNIMLYLLVYVVKVMEATKFDGSVELDVDLRRKEGGAPATNKLVEAIMKVFVIMRQNNAIPAGVTAAEVKNKILTEPLKLITARITAKSLVEVNEEKELEHFLRNTDVITQMIIRCYEIYEKKTPTIKQALGYTVKELLALRSGFYDKAYQPASKKQTRFLHDYNYILALMRGETDLKIDEEETPMKQLLIVGNRRQKKRPPLVLRPLTICDYYDDNGRRHKWTGYERDKKGAIIAKICEVCGVLDTETNKMDEKIVRNAVDKKYFGEMFWNYFRNKCPSSGLHTYNEADTCTKCGIKLGKRDEDYFNEYYEQFRNGIKSEKIQAERDIQIYTTPIFTDVPDEGYTSKMCTNLNIKPQIFQYLGDIQDETYKSVQNGLPREPRKTPMRLLRLHGYYITMLTEYNNLRFGMARRLPTKVQTLMTANDQSIERFMDIAQYMLDPPPYQDTSKFPFEDKYVDYVLERIAQFALQISTQKVPYSPNFAEQYARYIVKRLMKIDELTTKPMQLSFELIDEQSIEFDQDYQEDGDLYADEHTVDLTEDVGGEGAD